MDAADTARAAYAIGWARATAGHGIDVSESTKAGALAAMRLAATMHPDEVVEATLHLGHLEGIWAVVYRRREKLETAARQALTPAWEAFWRRVFDLDKVIARLPRREPTEAATPDPYGNAAAQEITSAVTAGVTTEEYRKLLAAAEEQLRRAEAEGRAQAAAILADNAGVDIDWDIAFQAGYDALANVDLTGIASAWLDKRLGQLAGQAGNKIADLWSSGASYGDMSAAMTDLLGMDTAAAQAAVDLLIGQGLSIGQLAAYQQAGVNQCDFITAGDQRVCQDCDNAENNGPYNLIDAPIPPLHPNCRCTLASSAQNVTDPSVFTDFVNA